MLRNTTFNEREKREKLLDNSKMIHRGRISFAANLNKRNNKKISPLSSSTALPNCADQHDSDDETVENENYT
jgi:hypothetical protein